MTIFKDYYIHLFLNLNDCNLYFFNNKIIKPLGC